MVESRVDEGDSRKTLMKRGIEIGLGAGVERYFCDGGVVIRVMRWLEEGE